MCLVLSNVSGLVWKLETLFDSLPGCFTLMISSFIVVRRFSDWNPVQRFSVISCQTCMTNDIVKESYFHLTVYTLYLHIILPPHISDHSHSVLVQCSDHTYVWFLSLSLLIAPCLLFLCLIDWQLVRCSRAGLVTWPSRWLRRQLTAVSVCVCKWVWINLSKENSFIHADR